MKFKPQQAKTTDWQKMRREAFVKRYNKVLGNLSDCVQCGRPIAESMLLCPWCGSDRNRFEDRTPFSYVCPRCGKGISPQWRFCPWCYGPGFQSPSSTAGKGLRYHSKCRYCNGKIMRFMRYCPWCRRKIRHNWQVRPFPEICTRCGWSVDSNFWNYCPWCKQKLI